MNWDNVFSEGRDFRVMNRLFLDYILEKANKATGRALDLGCGTGDLAVKLAQKGFTVEALDASAVALEKAAKRAADAGVSQHAEQADLNDAWPAFEEPFDLITCKLVLAFIKDQDSFLSQVGKLLKPGGVFLVVSPVLHPGHEYSPRLKNISIQNDKLDDLLGKHFTQVELIHDEYFEELIHEKCFLCK